MSSIQTGIELNDQFSGVLNNIISSVNLAVSAMADMQQSMNADIDTSSLQGARDEINQATAALNELNDAMQQDRNIQPTAPQVEQTAPDIAPPVVDGGNQEPIPVQIDPVLPDPLIEKPDPVPLEVQPNAPPDIDPVEVPVTWQTDNLDVFTGTGVERFQQEVQSANDMLNTLNTTQARISQTAQGMDILPDAAVQDMNTMQQRLSAIQQRIQQIENNPVNVGADNANAELEQLRMQLNQAIQEQNSLNQAMQNMDVSAANDAYLRLSQTVGNTERYIRDNVDEQGRFNQEISAGTQQANELTNTIKRAVAAYISIQSVGKALNISALASNMMTAFHNAICNVQSWFYNLLSTACSVIENIAAALNKLPFVSFDYSGISSAADDYAAKASEAAGNKEDYTSISDAFNEGFTTFDAFQDGWASDAFNAGAAWGDGVADKVSNFSLSDVFGQTDIPNVGDYTSGFNDAIANSGIGDGVGSIDDNTGKIKDSLDVTEEDLKYLRDIAEQEAINRFTTAEINVDMSGMQNTVNSGDDIDGFMTKLTDSVNEAVDNMTEGVHE